MPGRQHIPTPVVSWPVQSGGIPSLAAYAIPRPETGFGAASQMAGQASPIQAEDSGSYVLAGQGGMGKTQLAATYARALWQSRDVELLVWITASSRAAILTGYAEAFARTQPWPGDSAGGYGTGTDQDELARRFLRWLGESTRSWLVVLDDLADAADLAGLWPHGAMGRVVLTTRLPAAAISPPGHQARLIQVGPFSRREALAFLTARLFEDTAQRNGAVDLAATLGCLPIALAQAGTLVVDCRIDCLEYRRVYGERQAAMGISAGGGPAASVAVTWSLALDRADQLLPSALARPVLAILAMLDQAGVPAAVLTSQAAREYIGSYGPDRAAASDEQIRGALAALAQVGLAVIDPASTERTVSVHGLVQTCVRQVLPPAVRDLAAGAAASGVLQAWPDSGAGPQLDQALRDCAAALVGAAPEVMWSPETHPLLLRAGQSLDQARLSWPAIGYWRSLAEASAKALGSGSPQTLELMHRLAAAYTEVGRADLALEVLTEALAQMEQEQEPGDPETLTARLQLARACLAADRISEALPHFERALAGREWILGPDHPDTLAARSDLAGAYQAAGRLDDAITVYRRTMVDQALILGEDHPTTIATRGSLAAALHAAGQTRDAVPLLARTLADRERLLGPDHPDTMTALGNLAYAYHGFGKLKDAIPMYTRALADRERVQGHDHLDTITARANLASAYLSARRFKDALPLYQQTLQDRERVQGRDHPDTITARGDLASAYHSAGRLAAATRRYESALADCERVLGPRHENTLASRANLALAYQAAQRSTDAIALFRRTLADCELALPPDHPLTQSVRGSLEAAARA
ncbi:MAG TPA: tetratricopeptide repeat protein [Streptosporangiaceae bacterium]|jgi:tetratricopeptide (TPR) repeat protein